MEITALDRPVRSQSDLEHLWRELVGPLGFAGHSLWMLLVGADDLPAPPLSRLEDCPVEPDEVAVAQLVTVLGAVLEGDAPGGRWALLLSRPGAGGACAHDRAWARALHAGCRSAGVPLEVVHLATDDTLQPLPLDEIGGYVQAS